MSPCNNILPCGALRVLCPAFLVMDNRVNNPMKSDVGRRGCAFVSRMTFLFDIAIFNVQLKCKI